MSSDVNNVFVFVDVFVDEPLEDESAEDESAEDESDEDESVEDESDEDESLEESLLNTINKTMTSTSIHITYNMVFNIYI